jgi:hypothetical protein
MYVHQPHVATVFSVSANGRRVTERSHNITLMAPPYAQEDMITNSAIEAWDFGYDLGDTSLRAEIQEPAASGVILKRKVYENSVRIQRGSNMHILIFFQDYPMLTWMEHWDEYLDEMLRLEGRGFPAIHSKCGGCGKADPCFRCEHQTCYGPALYCQACVVERHAVLPTHWIQVRDNYWRKCFMLIMSSCPHKSGTANFLNAET